MLAGMSVTLQFTATNSEPSLVAGRGEPMVPVTATTSSASLGPTATSASLFGQVRDRFIAVLYIGDWEPALHAQASRLGVKMQGTLIPPL